MSAPASGALSARHALTRFDGPAGSRVRTDADTAPDLDVPSHPAALAGPGPAEPGGAPSGLVVPPHPPAPAALGQAPPPAPGTDHVPTAPFGVVPPRTRVAPGDGAAGAGPFAVDVLLFLDDDGRLAHPDTVQRCRAAFAADPRLGIISFRIADPRTGTTQRRHVPRLRARDPMRSSRVTTFLGGASAVRTEVIAEVGGLPADFFYAHEETDFAWRALDAGWVVHYRSDLLLLHPTAAPTRHAVYHRMVARNRVWLARRNLPAPLVPVYPGVWLLVTLARRPSGPALRAWLRGFREGWSTPCGPRRPMKWRTVWRLTRLGRPPVI